MKRLTTLVLVLSLAGCTAAESDDTPPDTTYDDGGVTESDEADTGLDAEITADVRSDGGEDMNTGDGGEPTEDLSDDMPTEEEDPGPSTFTFELGSGQPFEPWTDGGEIPVVAGFQGGFHTEHTARVDSRLPVAALDESQISVRLETEEQTLTEGAWIFYEMQWGRDDNDDWIVALPTAIMQDGNPHYDAEATLEATIELVDGRSETFSVGVTLVEQQ